MNRDGGIDPAAAAVLHIWFGDCAAKPELIEPQSKIWFATDPHLDEQLRREFGEQVERASRGELSAWEADAHERLALIILLDQFRRNIYRNLPQAFEKDSVALSLTLSGLATGLDGQLAAVERLFFLMPLQHSEAIDIQKRSVAEFTRLYSEAPAIDHATFAEALKSAHEHHDLIVRFGRFPHRNAILGRHNSGKETEYLAGHMNHFGQR